jgi:hypothetical protein
VEKSAKIESKQQISKESKNPTEKPAKIDRKKNEKS